MYKCFSIVDKHSTHTLLITQHKVGNILRMNYAHSFLSVMTISTRPKSPNYLHPIPRFLSPKSMNRVSWNSWSVVIKFSSSSEPHPGNFFTYCSSWVLFPQSSCHWVWKADVPPRFFQGCSVFLLKPARTGQSLPRLTGISSWYSSLFLPFWDPSPSFYFFLIF